MNLLDLLTQWLLGITQVIIGFLLGSIITGYFTVKWVIPRIMRNPDIQEALKLFRDGKSYLRQILENQRPKGGENLNPEEEKEEDQPLSETEEEDWEEDEE